MKLQELFEVKNTAKDGGAQYAGYADALKKAGFEKKGGSWKCSETGREVKLNKHGGWEMWKNGKELEGTTAASLEQHL
jgi:hypothetical protein